jgi:hypothetical protein
MLFRLQHITEEAHIESLIQLGQLVSNMEAMTREKRENEARLNNQDEWQTLVEYFHTRRIMINRPESKKLLAALSALDYSQFTEILALYLLGQELYDLGKCADWQFFMKDALVEIKNKEKNELVGYLNNRDFGVFMKLASLYRQNTEVSLSRIYHV